MKYLLLLRLLYFHFQMSLYCLVRNQFRPNLTKNCRPNLYHKNHC